MPLAYPVIFLPGVMGTRLFFPNSGRYWDPDDTIRMLSWIFSSDDRNRRRMHGSQTARIVRTPGESEITTQQAGRGWGSVVWSFYSTFLQFLEGLGGQPIYALGYDWRQDITALGGDVFTRIQRILGETGAEQVTLITHSMGGLVVRAAMRANPSLNDQVNRTIHICQPSAGAVLLYRRLFTGLVRRYDSGWGFRTILGTDRETFAANMSGLPGPMQLLPSNHFPLNQAGAPWNPGLVGATNTDALYVEANTPPGLTPPAGLVSQEVINDFRDRLTDVRVFHARLGAADPVTADPSKTWLIYGSTRPTEVSVQFTGNSVTPELAPEGGDTVVPIASATSLSLPAAQMLGVPAVVHDTACLNAIVQAIVRTILSLP